MFSEKRWIAALAFSALLWAQTDPPLSQALIDKLPEMYRESAKAIRLPEKSQQYYLTHSDESRIALVADFLARTDQGRAFLLRAVENETSGGFRAQILSALAAAKGTAAYADEHPEIVDIFQRHAAADPDTKAALSAFRGLRAIRTDQAASLLQRRMRLARTAGDQKGLEDLSDEESLHYKWFGEVAIPAANRDAPPLFSVVGPDRPIRVVAFGDFGTGEPSQIKTAAAIRAYAKNHPFDFGVTLGDNFYSTGMTGISDSRWKTQWEDLYGPLGIKFYASFGNHDYGQAASAVAEFWYSEKSPSWSLPARYYTFTAGASQFFQVDTVDLSEREIRWLDEQLAQSKAKWKIVYGHYQIYSATRGDNDAEQDDLVHRLLPVLKRNRVDVYICGHDHNLQLLKEDGGVHFVVAGGGGAGLYDFVQKNYDRSTFKEKTNGFAVIEADRGTLRVRLINVEGEELTSMELAK